jgi:hypothetical protein
VALSDNNEVEEVDAWADRREGVNGGLERVSPAVNSGVRLIVEDQGGERQESANSSKDLDPILHLHNSKLFGVQQQLGFTFSVAKDEQNQDEVLRKPVESGKLINGERVEGCQ